MKNYNFNFVLENHPITECRSAIVYLKLLIRES